MIFKRVSLGVVMSVLSVALLSACGGDGTQGGEWKGADEPAEIVIVNMYNEPEEGFNERYGNLIRKKFPHYTITYATRSSSVGHDAYIAEQTAIGAQMDIIQDPIGDYNVYVSNGLEVDLTDLIKKHNIDLNRLEPTTISYPKEIADGKLYGLPYANGKVVLYYNKELFDKFGVPYLTDGMTWDQVIETSKRFDKNESGVQYLGFSLYANFMINQNQYSIPIIDPKTDKPTINTDDRWKKFYQTIFEMPLQMDGFKTEMARLKREPNYNNFYSDRNLAMYSYSAELPLEEPKMKEFNWDMVSLPTFSDLPGVGSQGDPGYWGITKLSKYPDAAMQVLKFMVSDEMQSHLSKMGAITVLKDEAIQKLYATESGFDGKNWAAVYKDKYAPKAAAHPLNTDVYRVYVKYARQMQQGIVDVNTAFRMAEEEAIKVMEQAKAKQ